MVRREWRMNHIQMYFTIWWCDDIKAEKRKCEIEIGLGLERGLFGLNWCENSMCCGLLTAPHLSINIYNNGAQEYKNSIQTKYICICDEPPKSKRNNTLILIYTFVSHSLWLVRYSKESVANIYTTKGKKVTLEQMKPQMRSPSLDS